MPRTYASTGQTASSETPLLDETGLREVLKD